MAEFVLYQRDDCFLCDQALEVMAAAHMPDFTSRWVDDDTALEARYGSRVPVLAYTPTGAELDGPFSESGLRAFLHQCTR